MASGSSSGTKKMCIRDERRCIQCKKLIRFIPGAERTINTTQETELLLEQLNIQAIIGDVLCFNCKKYVCFNIKPKAVVAFENSSSQSSSSQASSSQSASESQSTQSSTDYSNYNLVNKEVEYVSLPVPRTVSSHSICCICRNTTNLRLIPFEARLQSYTQRYIFIPDGNRCCKDHLIPSKNRFYLNDLKDISIYSNMSTINVSDLTKIMQTMSLRTDSSILDKVGTFSISDKDLKTFTGLTWENIKYLTDMMVSMRNSDNRTKTQALITFLMKLRTGNSNRLISSILGIEREQTVSEYCGSVLNSFDKDILPTRFGFGSCSREWLIENHTSNIAKKLYGFKEELVLIFDGTYIRHQKSSNNEYQRKSYSGQKKAPLCKPFTICTTNSFVVDCPGPFYGTENDASIMKKVLSDPNGLSSILKPGDVCIVDRGFRDVQEYMENMNLTVLMPALKGKRNQLTCEESNESRKVTKLRWVVEAVHGVIGKKFRLLHQQLDNK